ncbi:VOC family protein [Umezawaea beigongshangensis]|uniref:VOC family protein n=1 Tax=Umezawaea beigongshangensis TaxID=2780383 RepID=UPI0018F2234C|nr:VOC family protein [Umezawaea beigongshangensis]
MSDSPVRGLRRVELCTPAPEAVAEFYAELLGWVVLPDPDGTTGGWVGDRLAVRVRPVPRGGAAGWRMVFAGERERDLVDPAGVAAGVSRGRVLHGPWAPQPRAGEPCWTELMTAPGGDTDAFWAAELGWRPRAAEQGFTLFDARCAQSTRAVAGRLRTTAVPAGWTCCFAVVDVRITAKAATASGGTVLVPPTEVPTGVVAVLADPAGGVFTLLQEPRGWGGSWFPPDVVAPS